MKDWYPEYTKNSQSSALKTLTTRSTSSKPYWWRTSLRKDALQAVRKTQVETTVTDRYTPVGTTETQIVDTAKRWRGRGAAGALARALPAGLQHAAATLADGVALPYKTTQTSARDPASRPLGTYSKKLRPCVHPDTCAWRFITAFSLLSPNV